MNNSKKEEKIIIDGVELKPGIFFGDEYLNEEDARKIAKRCPVLVEIVRRCNSKGMFERKLDVYTKIHYKKDGKEETISQITMDLLPSLPSGFVSILRKDFESFEDAEEWTKQMIDEVKKRREKIIKNKQREKSDELLMIV